MHASVIPKYLNYATISEDLLAIFGVILSCILLRLMSNSLHMYCKTREARRTFIVTSVHQQRIFYVQ
jgi:hypothetical protein